jgi:hypothetical protein
VNAFSLHNVWSRFPLFEVWSRSHRGDVEAYLAARDRFLSLVNWQRTFADGCQIACIGTVPAASVEIDAYDSIVERVMLRGIRINRAPERALMLAPPPLCPCCFTNVYFTARTPPPLDVAVACGNCGWSGIAGQVLECS